MPRVQLTKMTRIALYALRFYLIFLLIMILMRFIKSF